MGCGKGNRTYRKTKKADKLTCSDKFMRTTLCPEYFPKATIRLVFPTPGLPSSNTVKHEMTQDVKFTSYHQQRMREIGNQQHREKGRTRLGKLHSSQHPQGISTCCWRRKIKTSNLSLFITYRHNPYVTRKHDYKSGSPCLISIRMIHPSHPVEINKLKIATI